MSKKRINKNKKALVATVIGFFILGGIGAGVHIQHQNYINHPDSKKAIAYNAKNRTVTKTLRKFAKTQKLNVEFYDAKKPVNFNVLCAKLATGEYNKITLLAYSDGCPRCNSEKSELEMYLKQLATEKSPVIAINQARDAKFLSKYFDMPDFYHYPTIFEYDQNDNIGHTKNKPLTLSSKETIGLKEQ